MDFVKTSSLSQYFMWGSEEAVLKDQAFHLNGFIGDLLDFPRLNIAFASVQNTMMSKYAIESA